MSNRRLLEIGQPFMDPRVHAVFDHLHSDLDALAERLTAVERELQQRKQEHFCVFCRLAGSWRRFRQHETFGGTQ